MIAAFLKFVGGMIFKVYLAILLMAVASIAFLLFVFEVIQSTLT